MTSKTFTAEDFSRVSQDETAQSLTRPSLSYWQDAWIRLKANTRAIISLYIVIGLLVFTLFGPLIWTLDPAAQDLSQVSQPPGVDRAALIVPGFEPWQVDTTQGQGTGLRTSGLATTQFVRLLWDPIPGAAGGYRIYRNIFPIGPEKAYGLPLAEQFNAADTFYEDRLDLEPIPYYYTIVALDELGEETERIQSISLNPRRAITQDDAISRGLTTAENPAAVGEQVMVALHPLGTDYLGRDMLARLMEGARVSLFIGITAPFLYVLLGVLYGAAAGFLGGTSDQVMMRIADFVVALPFLLFMILFKVMFGLDAGDSGIMPMLIAMVILSWPATARLVRGQILQIREEGYISASRLLGAKTNYLVLRHMIPNTLGVILVTLTFAVPSAIFTEAFLSFIGMGVAPPTPSWGSMSNEGIKTMLTSPHELIFPALFISITVLAFNLLGDGLRDALDARMRSRE